MKIFMMIMRSVKVESSLYNFHPYPDFNIQNK